VNDIKTHFVFNWINTTILYGFFPFKYLIYIFLLSGIAVWGNWAVFQKSWIFSLQKQKTSSLWIYYWFIIFVWFSLFLLVIFFFAVIWFIWFLCYLQKRMSERGLEKQYQNFLVCRIARTFVVLFVTVLFVFLFIILSTGLDVSVCVGVSVTKWKQWFNMYGWMQKPCNCCMKPHKCFCFYTSL
jgi:hypothetical protein